MRAAEAQAGSKLCVIVGRLMLRQGRHQCAVLRQRVFDGLDGLIAEGQFLPSAAALTVGLGGIFCQALTELGAVMDKDSPCLTKAGIELGQGVQQGGIILAVPQDAGLVLIEAGVLRQGRRVTRTQLAQGIIHKPPPRSRAVANQKEILGSEEHRVEHIRKGCGIFCRHAVNGHFPLSATLQLNAGNELPIAGVDAPFQHRRLLFKADQFSICVGTGRLAAGEVDDGLQEVGLALRVLAVNDVAVLVEQHLLALVITKAL